MGYQIVFKYHAKKDKGFDVENQKEFVKHIGREDEDTPIEQVATAIRSEYARRDILVCDADLYEYTKKKVKLKEIRGGLIIKDKKIMFDDLQDKPTFSEKINNNLVSPIQQEATKSNISVSTSQTVSPISQKDKPLRYEYYYPPSSLLGSSLLPPDMTPGRKYAIFEETVQGRERGAEVKYYSIFNNKGTVLKLKEDYFSESEDPSYFDKPTIVVNIDDPNSVNNVPQSSDMILRKRR